MVTLVAEQVEEATTQPEIHQPETARWHYMVPCAGVRYYCYEPTRSEAAETDLWALSEMIINL